MFSYSENIAHFKGGISYEVQKSFYLVVQVVAASIVATSIINAISPIFNDFFIDVLSVKYKKRAVLVLLRTLKEFYLEGDTFITLVLCQ